MKEEDIFKKWQAYDQRLNESLAINQKLTLEITQLKVHSLLKATSSGKRITILLGIVWALLLLAVSGIGWAAQNPYLGVSMGLMALINFIAIGLYIYQLYLIHQVAVDQSVKLTQNQIARLKGSSLQIPRILFLQLPLWTTFYLTPSTFIDVGLLIWLVQLPITLAFLGLSVWLYNNIQYQNRNEKWFQLLFSGKEWDNILKSQDLIVELDDFQQEN